MVRHLNSKDIFEKYWGSAHLRIYLNSFTSTIRCCEGIVIVQYHLLEGFAANRQKECETRQHSIPSAGHKGKWSRNFLFRLVCTTSTQTIGCWKIQNQSFRVQWVWCEYGHCNNRRSKLVQLIWEKWRSLQVSVIQPTKKVFFIKEALLFPRTNVITTGLFNTTKLY